VFIDQVPGSEYRAWNLVDQFRRSLGALDCFTPGNVARPNQRKHLIPLGLMGFRVSLRSGLRN
jgi:hypothetical protein